MKIVMPEWAAWHFWPFFIVAFLVAIVALQRWYVRKKVVTLLNPPFLKIRLIHNYSFARSVVKLLLWICGIFFLVVTLLQPQWGERQETVKQEGRDIVIAIDVSRSMLAQDYAPNRLTFAKEKIKRLLRALPCERVALLLFSGSALVQCPLTTDYEAFLLFLNQLDAETISSGTTALDQALAKAIRLFSKNEERTSKIVVLLTDGEDFSSNLASIKQQAIAAGLQIFTVGVGTAQGAPIPLFDERGQPHGHQRDAQGNIVISRLNEGILKTLAYDSGGMYIQARKDDNDIAEIVDRVKAVERRAFEDRKIIALYDRYYYGAIISFVCFLVEWLL